MNGDGCQANREQVTLELVLEQIALFDRSRVHQVSALVEIVVVHVQPLAWLVPGASLVHGELPPVVVQAHYRLALVFRLVSCLELREKAVSSVHNEIELPEDGQIPPAY